MSKSHTCYFHKNKPITSFCTLSQCTLPMCQECLPIHSQEHLNHQDQASIISFQKAQQNAISQLKMKVNVLAKNKKQCEQALTNTKEKLYQIINAFVKQQQLALENMFSSLQQTEKKLNKIQRGSLKSLIYFYSSEEKKIEQFQRNSLAYRQSLEDKMTKCRESLNNSLTISLNQLGKKEQPDLATMRQIKAKASEVENNFERKYSDEKQRQKQCLSKRDYSKDRNSGRDGSDFGKQPRAYQHRQIFSQKSTDNLQLYSKNKHFYQEKAREVEKYEPEYTRNRIHTQVDYKQPSFKTSYDVNQKYKQYQPNFQNHHREQRKRINTFQQKEQSYAYNANLDKYEQDFSRKQKPLLPSDLNLQYTNSVRMSTSKGKDFKSKVQLSKEVLSPQEIRKMLQKRIQERSRIISKTKNMTTPSRHEDSAQQYERHWETKDSIINQIYNDYRY